MKNPKSRILQNYRLRPQRKGKLPNLTQDFQEYRKKRDECKRNKVEFSFQINKYGIQKERKISRLINENNFERNISINKIHQRHEINHKKQKSNNYTIQQNDPYNIQLYGKHLKYNQTRISPNHKIKIRSKSSKRGKQQNIQKLKCSNLLLRQIKFTELNNTERLPKINLTSRQGNNRKQNVHNKENINNKENNLNLKSSRPYFYDINPKDKYYTKLYHIVTLGKKALNNNQLILY